MNRPERTSPRHGARLPTPSLVAGIALVIGWLPACGGSEPSSPAAPAPAAPAESHAAAPGATAPAAAAEPVENEAPDFTLPDLDGNPVTLSAFRGKTVVLEWFNPGCPFVVHAHTKGPLKGMGPRKAGEGIVWLAVNSGAPGKQGHGLETNREAAKQWGISYPLLLDEAGDVGRAYDAKTTPHMYVIDPQGSIVYQGALDNAPFGKVPAEGLASYLERALAAVAAGEPVETAETQPYGCTVKYAD